MAEGTSNRRGVKTRAALVDAAWRLVDRMSLADLLRDLTPSSVAAEAGRTPGSFHHHFNDHEAFVSAMVDHVLLAHDADEEIEAVTSILEKVGDSWGPGLARAAARADWDLWQRPERRRRLLREDLVETMAPTTVLDDGRSLREVVAVEHWHRSIGQVSAMYDAFLDAMERRLVEPFTTDQVAKVIAAVLQGLLLSANVAPGGVDGEVFANLIACIVTTFSAPLDAPASVVDLEIGAMASRPSTVDVALARQWAHAALPAIDSGAPMVHFSTAATASGLDARDLATVFGTPRRLAAAAMAVALPDLDAAVASVTSFADVRRCLRIIADHARGHPLAARALLAERDVLRSPELGGDGGFDIGSVVPFDGGVAAALVALGADGSSSAEVVSIAVDSALLLATSRSDWSDEEVARVASAPLGASLGR